MAFASCGSGSPFVENASNHSRLLVFKLGGSATLPTPEPFTNELLAAENAEQQPVVALPTADNELEEEATEN